MCRRVTRPQNNPVSSELARVVSTTIAHHNWPTCHQLRQNTPMCWHPPAGTLGGEVQSTLPDFVGPADHCESREQCALHPHNDVVRGPRRRTRRSHETHPVRPFKIKAPVYMERNPTSRFHGGIIQTQPSPYMTRRKSYNRSGAISVFVFLLFFNNKTLNDSKTCSAIERWDLGT